VEHLPAPDHQPLLESELMATDTVTKSQADNVWTSRLQHLNSTVKPVKLLELGENERGKFARIEFEDEATRPIYLQTMEDAWHPLFDSLTSKERWKIRGFFNSFDSEKLPGGNVKTKFNVSFVTRTVTKKEAYVSQNCFDVPAQSCDDGELTGLKMAKEYIAALALPNFECLSLIDIVDDMARFFVEEADLKYGELKRRNVAVGFLRELECMLLFATKNCNHRKYFDEKIVKRTAYLEQHEQRMKDRREKKKTEFLDRMRKGREAKRKASQDLEAATA